MSIVSICLSPGIQRSVSLASLVRGEVNRLADALVDVSGKGINVARVLQRLGVAACCLSQGGDNANELMALAKAEGLDLRMLPSSGRLRTCTSIIETGLTGGARVTELVEPGVSVDAACIAALTAMVGELLPAASALVIAGSMAPGFPADYQAQLAASAKSANVPVFLDIQGAPLRAALAAEPAVVKINLSEFVATFLPGRFAGGEHSGKLAEAQLPASVVDAVAEVSRAYATRFVLTRGARSILLVQAGEIRTVPVTPLAAHEILSPIGSGDAFLAGMVAKLAQNGELRAKLDLDVLEKTIPLAIACAQSNARTARPGFLEAGFEASRCSTLRR